MLKISKGDFEVFLKIVVMIAVIVGAAFLLYVLWLLRSVVVLFLISLVLVFILRPAVDWFSKGSVKFKNGKTINIRIPRILSIFLVFALVFLLLFFIVTPIINLMIAQANSLFQNLDKITGSISEWAEKILKVKDAQIQSYINTIQNNLQEFLVSTIKSLPGLLQSIFTTFAGYIFNAFIILIITIFFLLDWDKINLVIFSLIPQKTSDTAKGLLGAVYKQIWGYIKAQASLSFMIGALIAILSFILGSEAFLIIGIVVALGEMVPYIGPIVSFSVGFLLVLFTAISHADFSLLLWYSVGFLVIEQILAQAIAAPLIAKKANTHPLLVILVMFSFATLFSPYAVLLAVPFLVFARAIFSYLVSEKRVLEKLGIALEPTTPPLSPLISKLRKPFGKTDRQ